MVDLAELFQLTSATDCSLLDYLNGSALYTLCHASLVLRRVLLALRPCLSFHVHPGTLRFDTLRFPVSQLVAGALLSDPLASLDLLHVSLDSPPTHSPQKGAFKNEWLAKWHGSPQSKTFFQTVYPLLVRDLVSSLLSSRSETHLYYSTTPLLRCSPPTPDPPRPSSLLNESNRKALAKETERSGVLTTRHADGDYGHPTGEINFWFPCTSVATGSNSLWVDRTPWVGEEGSEPLELVYGEVGVF